MEQKREIQKKPSSSGSRTKKGTPKAQGKWGRSLGYFSPGDGSLMSQSSGLPWWAGIAATAPPRGTGNGKLSGVKNPLHSMEPFLQVGRSNFIVFFLPLLSSGKSLHKVVYELLSSHSICVGMDLMLNNIKKTLKTAIMGKFTPRFQTDH